MGFFYGFCYVVYVVCCMAGRDGDGDSVSWKREGMLRFLGREVDR